MPEQYDADLLDLIKANQVLGNSPELLVHNKDIVAIAGDTAALRKHITYYQAELEDLKEISLMQLDRTIAVLTQIMVTATKNREKTSAARVLITALDRRARFLGLDSPVKVDASGHVQYSIEGVDVGKLLELPESSGD